MVAEALSVTDDQRVELARLVGSSVAEHRQVVQAPALLWAADGLANQEIAPSGAGGPGHGEGVAQTVRREGDRRDR